MDKQAPLAKWGGWAAGRGIARALAAFIFLGSTTSFLGWAFNIRRLTDWDNNGISIQPNAALCVSLTAIGLALLSTRHIRTAALFGGFTALIGAATLFERISGISLGIDALLLFK